MQQLEKQYESKVVQVRLYPDKVQKNYLAQCFGCCRWIYNHLLDKNNKQYEEDQTFIWYVDAANELPKLKKQEETKWLKNVDSTCLQAAAKNLDGALHNFCNSKSGKRKGTEVGYPQFKKRYNRQSAKFTSNKTSAGASCKVDFDEQKIKIPKLTSWIDFANEVEQDRIPNGTLQSITITKTPTNNYYASLLFKVEKEVINYEPNPENSIGIDFGLKTYLTLSNGEEITAPKPFQKSQKKLARLQRQHSRKKTNSKNREKSRLRLAKLHEHVAKERKDFNHKTSKKLTDEYDFIFVEDLNLKGMSRRRKRKKPDAKTRKKGLGKYVNDLAYGRLVSFMNYKAERQGKHVIKTDRYFPSSKLCSVCGYKKDDLKLNDREWICPHCGTYHNRDLNAAINIHNKGLQMLLGDENSKNTVGTTEIKACIQNYNYILNNGSNTIETEQKSSCEEIHGLQPVDETRKHKAKTKKFEDTRSLAKC